MSFLTPLGWVLSSTGVLAPVGIPMILADKTSVGQALGNSAERAVSAAVTGASQATSKSALSDAQAAWFQDLNKRVLGYQPKTSKAKKLKNDWIQWFNGLSFWQQNFDEGVFNEGRNRFIDITAYDTDDPQAVKDAWKVTPSLEQTLGLPDPRTTDGYYPVAPKPLIPDIPLGFKVGAAVSAVGIIGTIALIKWKL